jgi:outer membrane protein assembly factor BamD (BamD/ComL family)
MLSMKYVTSLLAILLGILLVAGCAKMKDDALMAKGKELEEQSKFDDAIKIYQKVAKNYYSSPFCAEAYYHIALIQSNGLMDYKSSVGTFENLIEKFPESKFASQAQFMIGFIYANNISDTTLARKAYQKFIDLYPTHELVPSVQWELKYLGKPIDEIPELMNLEPAQESHTKK